MGLTLALRGGLFRKLIYGAFGVGATAAVCYPEKARETVQIGFFIAGNKLNPIIRDQTGIDVQQKLNETWQQVQTLTNSFTKKEE